jgi:5-dehydro-2-deoxygluconokinase
VQTLDGPVYMLAADHRWQWEDWCDQHGVAHSRIPDAKRVALDGLLAARRRSADARRSGAFLVDQQYASEEIERARAAGVAVATPVERPGVFPLEWAANPFWRAAVGEYAKVLVRHKPEWDATIRATQFSKLRTLGDWCRANDRVFLLEVLVGTSDEQREHELPRFIRDAYAAGVVPDYWKIEGSASRAAMQKVDAAVAERPDARLVILGKGAAFEAIESWFDAAAEASTAAGFAIGRSVYWQPAADFLLDTIDEASAAQQIADNYLRVIDAWKSARYE